ncbi:AraC family transcriptional regulator [Fervidibacillus albus]|uniref:AraC family transcriptional regulator n=1 Tax=Fervidibacillus albus TaxID=2980026 RepID=A0A9E8RX57_9BACI|nr:AraC family transcriptional regulator [Fervidibacillus albus]WAA09182.1 AraC family transcriptional regulator [Fervidibacillus albus]
MHISANLLIEYFASSTFQFFNGFVQTVRENEIDTGRKTAPNLCGFVLPIKGHAKFSLNGTIYHMNRHAILHTGSAMDLCISAIDGDFTYTVIHYEIVHTSKKFEQYLHQHFSISVDEMSKPLLFSQQLIKEQTKPDNFSKFQLQVIFMKLLESIVNRARTSQHDNKLQLITESLDYIHHHYTEELSINELASLFGLNRRKFSYLFSQVTGLSPIQYLTAFRIARAKELLEQSNHPISKIAEAVGYQDSFYFSRVFKKQEGVSPLDFRKQIKKHPSF